MKRLALVCVLALAAACERSDFAYADGAGGRFSDWTGGWVVINYWAEWCAPCRYEIPELNELAAERAKDVRVLGVNYDGIRGTELAEVGERMGIEFTILADDPQPHFGYDRPSVLPTTVLIGPDGQVREVLVGPQTRDSLERAISSTTSL